MNKARRKEIRNLLSELEELQDKLEELHNKVESIHDEEESAYDNLPESLQASDRGWRMEECISNLESAMGWLEELNLDELTGSLEDCLSD